MGSARRENYSFVRLDLQSQHGQNSAYYLVFDGKGVS